MVPTQNQLLDFVNDYMNKREGHLWNYYSLVDAARNHFKTTTPAVTSRLEVLINAGMIRQVKVDYSGLIFWSGGDFEDQLPNCHLIEPENKGPYDRLSSGPVVLSSDHERSKNLWANGVSWFYISNDGYTALTAKIAERSRELEEAHRKERKERRDEARNMIRAAGPDGVEILRRLQGMMSNGRMSSVRPTNFREDPGVEMWVAGEADLTAFLDVLRRGFKSLDDENAAS